MDNQAFKLLTDTLTRIEDKIDGISTDHNNRIDSLEGTRDKQNGMIRLAVIIASSISGFISFVGAVLFKSH